MITIVAAMFPLISFIYLERHDPSSNYLKKYHPNFVREFLICTFSTKLKYHARLSTGDPSFAYFRGEMQQKSPLFTLPPEIRRYVYSYVLLDDEPNIKLLLVCREIYHEAVAIFLALPLTLLTDAELAELTRKFSPNLLRRVENIRINFPKITWATMLDPHKRREQYMHGFDTEKILRSSRSFVRSLKALPNLSALTILDSPRMQYFDIELGRHDLLVISSNCANLRKLTLDGVMPSFQFLRKLPLLEVLRFTGYSFGKPDNLLVIIRELQNLVDIELLPVQFPLPIDPSPQYLASGARTLRMMLSFTPDVLKGIQPLRHFGIYERWLNEFTWHNILTTDMVVALRDAHFETLSELRITSTKNLNSAAMLHLLDEVKRSKIIDFAAIGPVEFAYTALRALPDSVETLRVLICSPEHKVLAPAICGLAAKLPLLKNLKIGYCHPTKRDGSTPSSSSLERVSLQRVEVVPR